MNIGTRRSRESFRAGFVHACLPLGVWALHFFACYVFVAVGCRAGLDAKTAMGVPLLTLTLMTATLLAIAALGLIFIRPVRRHPQRSGEDAIGTAFRRGAAALSLVAVTWTGLPMALLQSCLQ